MGRQDLISNKRDDTFYKILFETLFDNISDYACLKDKNSKFIKINPKAAEALGVKKPNDAVGKSDYDFFPEIAKETRKDELQMMKTGKAQINKTKKVKFADKTTHWITTTKLPYYDKNGEIAGVAEISRDITDEINLNERLIKKNAELEETFKATPCALVFADLYRKITKINPAFEKLFGYNEKELIGKKTKILYADKKEFYEQGKKRYNKKARAMYKPYEIKYKKKNGEVFISESIGTPIVDKNDQVVGLIASVRDITEWKKYEDELKKSEENYKTIFNSSSDAIFLHDTKNMLISDVNEEACKRYGYSCDEMKKLTVDQISATNYSLKNPIFQKMIQKVAKGKTVNVEWLSKKKNGELFWQEVTGKLIEINGEKQFLAIVKDINEKKKADEKLKESQERYKTLIESTKDSVYVLDYDWKHILVNNAATEFTGFSKEELIGHRLQEVFPGVEKTPFFKTFERVMKTKKPEKVSNEYLFEDGHKGYYEVNVTPIPEGIFCISRDISKNKKAEEKLIESEKKYRALVENMQEGIWQIDKNSNTSYVNQIMAKMLDYTTEEMLGKHLFYFMDEKNKKICQIYLNRKKHGIKEEHEFEFRKKSGEKLITLLKTTPILDEKGKYNGALATLTDITEKKKREKEMKKQLMKYNLEEGNVYLLQEKTNIKSIKAFNDLIKAGYHGIIISRDTKENYTKLITNSFEHLWLAEETNKNTLKPDVKTIQKLIEKETNEKAILIDRLDYILSKNGHKKILCLIQNLKEIAYLQNKIILISLDPYTLKQTELREMEKETKEVEPKNKIILDEKLHELLKYIFDKNVNGEKPSYTEIGQYINSSKPTTRNKIRQLIKKGYLSENTKGRKKILEITEKTRSIFT